MDKVIRDGKVAVLYSPGFGAGWSTWCYDDQREASLYDTEIVNLLEKDGDNRDEITKLAEEKYSDFYTGGVRDLTIVWLPVGTRFVVEEYDGNESIRILDEIEFFIA